jgi:hypothetical protein
MYEAKASLESKKGELRRAKEERDAHRTAWSRRPRRPNSSTPRCKAKRGELQQEHAALSEARSQLVLKDAALAEA